MNVKFAEEQRDFQDFLDTEAPYGSEVTDLALCASIPAERGRYRSRVAPGDSLIVTGESGATLVLADAGAKKAFRRRLRSEEIELGSILT
jgi:thiamine monophosphate kinase